MLPTTNNPPLLFPPRHLPYHTMSALCHTLPCHPQVLSSNPHCPLCRGLVQKTDLRVPGKPPPPPAAASPADKKKKKKPGEQEEGGMSYVVHSAVLRSVAVGWSLVGGR